MTGQIKVWNRVRQLYPPVISFMYSVVDGHQEGLQTHYDNASK